MICLIGAALVGFVLFRFLQEFAELGDGPPSGRGRGGGAEAAVAPLLLGGAQGAFGTMEEGGRICVLRWNDGGDAHGNGRLWLGGVVHGCDDLLAYVVCTGRSGAWEHRGKEAATLWHDPVVVAGAVDTNGFFQVSRDFRICDGSSLIERHQKKCQWFPFGGATVPRLLELLLE